MDVGAPVRQCSPYSRRTMKSLKKSGMRCRIGAAVFVVVVRGRPRGAPLTSGEESRCSIWFP